MRKDAAGVLQKLVDKEPGSSSTWCMLGDVSALEQESNLPGRQCGLSKTFLRNCTVETALSSAALPHVYPLWKELNAAVPC